MISVVAIITTKPGKRPDVLKIFKANVPNVLAEAGCIEYGPNIDTGMAWLATFGEDTFVVLEKWESEAALMAHMKAPHMVAYGQAVRDMLADRKVYVVKAA